MTIRPSGLKYLILGALALAGCSGDIPAEQVPPDPLLFEISNDAGETEGWLLGTIHALPDGTDWRTRQIDEVIAKADYLVVEIAGLDDRARLSSIFNNLAATRAMPDIMTRVAPSYRPALAELMQRGDFERADFRDTETWAAALMLAQVEATGDAENGADRTVIRMFEGREVREFEGALGQLRIFDELEETDQRDLLEGVIEETQRARSDPSKLREAWISGDESALEEVTRSGIMADRELREALLVERNRNWTDKLVKEFADGARPLVAVGTGHMVGPDSINEMLQERGYTVTRLRR